MHLEGLRAEHVLYRAVQREINADPDCVVGMEDVVFADRGPVVSDGDAKIQTRLDRLPVQTRSALALAAIDGFDVSEVAYILDSTAERAATWIIEAFEALGGWAGRTAGVLTNESKVGSDIVDVISAIGLDHVMLDDRDMSDRLRRQIAIFVVEDDADPDRLHDSPMGARLSGLQGRSRAPTIYVARSDDDRTVTLNSQRMFFVGRPLERPPVMSVFRQALASGLSHAA